MQVRRRILFPRISLFFEASLTLIPFLTVVIWKREKLWLEQHGRRATIGVVGSLMVMFSSMGGVKHNVPSPAVIFTHVYHLSRLCQHCFQPSLVGCISLFLLRTGYHYGDFSSHLLVDQLADDTLYWCIDRP